jgi:hypothetical protein
MLFNKIQKTKNRFRAYHTHQAVQTTGSTAYQLPVLQLFAIQISNPRKLNFPR